MSRAGAADHDVLPASDRSDWEPALACGVLSAYGGQRRPVEGAADLLRDHVLPGHGVEHLLYAVPVRTRQPDHRGLAGAVQGGAEGGDLGRRGGHSGGGRPGDAVAQARPPVELPPGRADHDRQRRSVHVHAEARDGDGRPGVVRHLEWAAERHRAAARRRSGRPDLLEALDRGGAGDRAAGARHALSRRRGGAGRDEPRRQLARDRACAAGTRLELCGIAPLCPVGSSRAEGGPERRCSQRPLDLAHGDGQGQAAITGRARRDALVGSITSGPRPTVCGVRIPGPEP